MDLAWWLQLISLVVLSQRVLCGTGVEAPPASAQPTGGVLIRDGQQTSCELAPIGNAGVFVAASCLDAAETNTSSYQLAMYTQGVGAAQLVPVDPQNIHVHPEYNRTTYFRNIAVIKLRAAPTGVRANIVYARAQPNNVTYRRLVLDDALDTWDDELAMWQNTPNAECRISSMYTDTLWAFTCTTDMANVTVRNASYPRMPWASASVAIDGRPYGYALHSHSIVDSPGAALVSYYTTVAQFTGFAAQVLATTIEYYDANNKLQASSPLQFAIRPPAQVLASTVAGDLYALPADALDSVEGSAGETSPEASMFSSASGAPQDTKPETHIRRGLSGAAIAGIAVGVSVVVLVALGLVARWLLVVIRRRRAERYWDREMEKMQSRRSLPGGQPLS
ncbi:hypothetical protein LPJ63_003535 [Coemansia sp. RSA 2711]|nr:hypothetical protein LPJ63_003535 [Coemansia sp. RSA 2711]